MLTVHFLMHWQAFNLPAVGNHVWRQVNTLAVARNYFEEDPNILLPRVDKREDTPGITGPSFPAYEWMLSLGYHAFGYSETLHRFWSWLIFAIGIWGFKRLLQSFELHDTGVMVGTLAFAFSPELFYHSVNAVPDVLALTAMVWGWLGLRKWILSPKQPFVLWASTLALALAGMVKMQFLVVAFPVAALFFRNGWKPIPLKVWLQMTAAALAILLPTLWWYGYARELTARYGLHEFVHAMRHAQSIAQALGILAQTFWSTLPETWAGYGSLLWLVLSWKYPKNRGLKNEWGAYALGCLLFYFAVQYQFIHHGYYGFIFIPALAIFAGFGAMYLQQLTWGPKANLLLVFAVPILAYIRVVPANWSERNYRIPQEFISAENRDSFKQWAPPNGTAIVGPDQTGCVFLYYLRIKGFNLHQLQEWEGAEGRAQWQDKRERGLQYLVTHQPKNIPNYVRATLEPKPIHRKGEFYWFKIKPLLNLDSIR